MILTFCNCKVNINRVFYQLVLILISLLQYLCKDLHDRTYTSAIKKESTSPIPSTMFRRIGINSNDFNNIWSLLNISNPTRRRVQSHDIWQWDKWCQLQPKKGQCKNYTTKYYYDIKLDKCTTFVYSGCSGNKNNFGTEYDCERHCKGATAMALKVFRRPELCHLQPDIGMCIAIASKYYYDINESTCNKFVYGGCGGNLNKFDTVFSCLKACGNAT